MMEMVHVYTCTVLNNLHFNFHSVKVTSLLNTMALFTSTDISWPNGNT